MNYISGVWRHGAETILSFYHYPNKEIEKICKSASTINGIKSIQSEVNGLNWYNNRSENKILYKYNIYRKNYSLITIFPNSGFYNPSQKNLENNIFMYMDILINHYIYIWFNYKNSKYAPIHGDLSLVGNVLFNKSNEAIFIDWEHFTEKSEIPTGFDPLMIMFENMYFEYEKSNNISLNTFNNTVYLIKKINSENLLSEFYYCNPLRKTINTILDNCNIWNGQHYKLPILKIPPKIITIIDTTLNNLLDYNKKLRAN